ncbi:MAG: hypothetical protein J6O41_02640 [Clostridia bacterium]|nr:hypothetical protein [Clostridia bacterium]
MKLQVVQKDNKYYGKLPDSDWVDVPLSNNKLRKEVLTYRKVGNIVEVVIIISANSEYTPGNTEIIATGLPKTRFKQIGLINSETDGKPTLRIAIDSDGILRFWYNSSPIKAWTYYAQCTYIS